MIRQEAPTSIPWWVLIVSVIAGLLLMTAVILILHKVRTNRCLAHLHFTVLLAAREPGLPIFALTMYFDPYFNSVTLKELSQVK